MAESAPPKSFLKALGPGLLFAGAAVGVSHLVQSTRAGAEFGLGLVGVVLFANFFKYPAFQFGPRYAAATGTSLLEGYRRQGMWALVLFALLTLATMFTVQAAVTAMTAALFTAVLGVREPILGQPPLVVFSALLTAVCAGLLLVGRYKWLDKIIKVVVAVLTVTTLVATAAVIPKLPWSSFALWPGGDILLTAATALALCGLIGWMPSAFDISIWHSLWTLARRRQTGHAPSVRDALVDFDVGYIGTTVLGVMFVCMGAGVMYQSGQKFAPAPAAFAAQVIGLYTENLGAWIGPVVAISAFTVMFSTTLTVVDGFPRAIATLWARFGGPEQPGVPDAVSRKVYWGAIVVLALGALVVIEFFATSIPRMADTATSLSLLTAAPLAWLNHRAMTSAHVPPQARPGAVLRAWSWLGIGVSVALAAYYVWFKWVA
ncbi:MAG: divalent metal cation transporter [Planctomycetes bacterium]|nr:divalent metal cation transporter [Planctomycetota bacterium]MCL4729527.1 divalent metal cation transporter [Planctomycetota bacterium]